MQSLTNWPSFSQEEANAVSEVLLSNKVNYWTGTKGREFEKAFATFCQSDYAVAVSNGTVALDLCLYALGIGSHNGGSENDEVIVTPRTFIASISSIVLAGARPVFADVELASQNISPETVAPKITQNTRAIIAVHLAGWPCDMDGFNALAKKQGLKIIEDCAQAHGALYKGKSVGSLGDIAAWSFCQDKIMTTGGEGGMVTTNNKALWQKVWAFKDHGKSFQTVYNKQHPPGFRWLHESFGTNWRLTEMQSAVGLIQLEKMPAWQQKREQNALEIAKVLEAFEFITVPKPNDNIRHAYYKCYAFIKPEFIKQISRDGLIAALNAKGVPCMQGSCSEVYLEKAFDGTGFRPEQPLVNAKLLGQTSLMFLVHPSIKQNEFEQMLGLLQQVLAKFKEQL